MQSNIQDSNNLIKNEFHLWINFSLSNKLSKNSINLKKVEYDNKNEIVNDLFKSTKYFEYSQHTINSFI